MIGGSLCFIAMLCIVLPELKRMEKENIDYFYCSPLGRAQKTASYTMEKYPDKEMPTLEWAREFQGTIGKGVFKKQGNRKGVKYGC